MREKVKMITLLRALLASFALALSAVPAAVKAASVYDFGNLLSGSFAPTGSFAQLSVTPVAFNVFNFSLTSNNLNALFTNGAFIGGIAVNTTPSVTASNVSISNFSGNGVDGVFAQNGGGPGGGWEFRFDVGAGGGGQQGAQRLGANESASWTATFNSATQVQFEGQRFAMHVQGLTGSQGGSAWYTPSASSASPAPEPEIYAMMLSGLLLVGFAARRRRPHFAS
jgi:hypothetical protein